ncbi:15285_t:CDS:2, partial [Rhizophagus irregularis]
NPKHPIPHNYIVETQYGKANHIVKCSINYVEGKPLFKVNFGENFAKEVHSLESSTEAASTNKGKISGLLLFGLKLLSVERVHKSVTLKIQPFSELSNTTRRRKMLCLSQCILDAVEEEKENMFHPTDQIKLKQVKFESYNDLYDINFEQQ